MQSSQTVELWTTIVIPRVLTNAYRGRIHASHLEGSKVIISNNLTTFKVIISNNVTDFARCCSNVKCVSWKFPCTNSLHYFYDGNASYDFSSDCFEVEYACHNFPGARKPGQLHIVPLTRVAIGSMPSQGTNTGVASSKIHTTCLRMPARIGMTMTNLVLFRSRARCPVTAETHLLNPLQRC